MTVTRFAPSPTGLLHVGNLRAAVLNWLIARKAGGTFVLRIDDTDASRSEERYVDAIRRDLAWLGLGWDREERQSAHLPRYMAALERLSDAGRAYACYESPLELELKRKTQLATGRPPVYDRAALKLSDAERARLAAERAPHWRFLLDHEPVAWDDLIRGPETMDAASVSDPVLLREDGQLLYTLASVVDDAEMGITHVVRGADHVTNTGAQVQIFRALGAEPPAFAHHSLLTGPSGEGLSKRLGALSLAELREGGVEPMALLSFMARLGSSQPVEVLTRPEELVTAFDIGAFGRAPTRFDPDELRLHSRKTLRAMPLSAVDGRLRAMGVPESARAPFWAAVAPNLERLDDAADWWALCRDGVALEIPPDDALFAETALSLLPAPPWGETAWAAWSRAVGAATGRKGKALFLPLRRLLTGRDRGPDMAALMPLLGPPRR